MLCGNKATGVKLICVNPTESDVPVANAMKGAPASFKVPALSSSSSARKAWHPPHARAKRNE